MLITVLIVIFFLIIVYQLYLYLIGETIIEGMSLDKVDDGSFQPYNTNDPNNAMILAQQNAGNIQVMEKQINNLSSLTSEIQDMSANLVILNQQVGAIIQQQSAAAQQIAGNKPLDITSTQKAAS